MRLNLALLVDRQDHGVVGWIACALVVWPANE
jgi:hypothetical protein